MTIEIRVEVDETLEGGRGGLKVEVTENDQLVVTATFGLDAKPEMISGVLYETGLVLKHDHQMEVTGDALISASDKVPDFKRKKFGSG